MRSTEGDLFRAIRRLCFSSTEDRLDGFPEGGEEGEAYVKAFI